jgi:hypothetical protein
VVFATCACAPPIDAALATANTEIDCSSRDLKITAKELDIAGLPYRSR